MSSKAPYIVVPALVLALVFRTLPFTMQVHIVLIGSGAVMALLFGVMLAMAFMAVVQFMRK